MSKVAVRMAGDDSNENWLKASIVWIDEKPDAKGETIKEVIYELHDDPDMLRQVNLPAAALYADARRGDKILVQPESSKVVRDETVA